WMDETFELRIRNHKKEAVDVRAVEHLYRWTNWKISEQSSQFKRSDARTIEFPVTIAPNGEQVITYTVHYSWQGAFTTETRRHGDFVGKSIRGKRALEFLLL